MCWALISVSHQTADLNDPSIHKILQLTHKQCQLFAVWVVLDSDI